jgi:hypothetical protein
MAKVVGGVAALVGYFVRLVLVVAEATWRLVPFMIITYGVQQISMAAAWIVAGVFLWIIIRPTDRRTK